MKILHIVPTYLPATRYGGPIYSVHGLCKALASQGHDVHVFTTNVDGDRDSKVPIGEPVDIDGVNVWYFQVANFQRWFVPFKSLFRKLARRLYFAPQMRTSLSEMIRDFDLVHLHSVFLWPTSMAARLAHAVDVPYVLSPRGMLVKALVKQKSYLLKESWLRLVERETIEHAARVHVTSSDEETDMTDFSFHFPPVMNIPNGVELPHVWSHEDVAEDVARLVQHRNYVVYLGRINWKKGLDRLIREWVNVPGRRLVIAGNDEEGYLKTLQDLVDELSVRDQVTFIPRFVSGVDKEALLHSADMLVLPSYSENFGNVVPEAMIRGLPVIVTEEVGARNIVQESGGGAVCGGRDLGRTIKSLIDNTAARKQAGQQARDWVLNNLSWDKVATEMSVAYSQLTDDSTPR